MENSLAENIAQMKGQLIVGNHDSITLYGSNIQSRVADTSRSISELIIHSNDELEGLLQDITEELTDFQLNREPSGIAKLFNGHNNRSIRKQYFDILAFLDKATLAMKLQEAQLIKDCKLIEMIISNLEKYSGDLESLISDAEKVLHDRKISDVKFKNEEDIEKWFNRLSGRVEDLKITNTISKQNIVQMGMMLDNNRMIIDKILFAVTGTIPAWRNQITILLGMDKITGSMATQQNIVNTTADYLTDKQKEIRNDIRKLKAGKDIDYEKLNNVNSKLQEALSALAVLEEKDKAIKDELKIESL